MSLWKWKDLARLTGRSTRTLQRLEKADPAFPVRVLLPTGSFGFRPEEVKRWWSAYATEASNAPGAITSSTVSGSASGSGSFHRATVAPIRQTGAGT